MEAAPVNVSRTLIERHWTPENFEDWELDPVLVRQNLDLWELVCRIEELEAELAELRARPIKGGPPAEWDGWILALPDKEFLDCLGLRNQDDPHRPRTTRRSSPLPQRGISRRPRPLVPGGVR